MGLVLWPDTIYRGSGVLDKKAVGNVGKPTPGLVGCYPPLLTLSGDPGLAEQVLYPPPLHGVFIQGIGLTVRSPDFFYDLKYAHASRKNLARGSNRDRFGPRCALTVANGGVAINIFRRSDVDDRRARCGLRHMRKNLPALTITYDKACDSGDLMINATRACREMCKRVCKFAECSLH